MIQSQLHVYFNLSSNILFLLSKITQCEVLLFFNKPKMKNSVTSVILATLLLIAFLSAEVDSHRLLRRQMKRKALQRHNGRKLEDSPYYGALKSRKTSSPSQSSYSTKAPVVNGNYSSPSTAATSSKSPAMLKASEASNSSATPSVSPSVAPTTIPSNFPSINISASPTMSPTSSPSLFPSLLQSFNPSNVGTLQPSIVSSTSPSKILSETPTLLSSVRPTDGISEMPTFIRSSQPSVNSSLVPTTASSSVPSISSSSHPTSKHSNFPSANPSSVPSINVSEDPSSFQDSLHTVSMKTLLNINKELDNSEVESIESLLVQSIMSTDENLLIVSVDIESYRLMSSTSSDGRTLKEENDESFLECDITVVGKTLDSPSSVVDFETRVEAAIEEANIDEELRRIVMAGQADGPNEESKSNKGLFMKIGLGIGGGALVLAMFAGFRLRNVSHIQLNGNSSFGSNIRVFEAEQEDIHQRAEEENNVVAFVNNDRFSSLTYSDTTSEYVPDPDNFMMSLTSSSMASGTLTTTDSLRNDTALTHAHLHSFLQPKEEPQVYPSLDSLPVQHARYRVREEDRRDLDEESSEDSLNLQAINQGVKRMFACFGPTTNFGSDGFKRTISGLMSEKTPKISNTMSHENIQVSRGHSSLSVVSSLSGRSSCSGSITLTGEPYEVVVPTNKSLGLIVKTSSAGPKIVHVKPASPLEDIVEVGDYILSVDSVDARSMSARALSRWLHANNDNESGERTMILMSRPECVINDTDEV